MYKCIQTIHCDVCQAEFQYSPSSNFTAFTLDSQCEENGWLSIKRHGRPVEHVCPGCIRTVGYAHAFGLVEAALQKFDPQTYANAELVWRVGDEYLSYAELVNLTHSEEDK